MESTRLSLATVLRPGRRWVQFSFRGFLIVLAIGCLWLGWKVERSCEQREAVKAIEAAGGFVLYDWQLGARLPAGRPPGPEWLQWLVGKEFFQDIETAGFEPPPGPKMLSSVIDTVKRVMSVTRKN